LPRKISRWQPQIRPRGEAQREARCFDLRHGALQVLSGMARLESRPQRKPMRTPMGSVERGHFPGVKRLAPIPQEGIARRRVLALSSRPNELAEEVF
jgi:hypothetical protein